MNRVGKTKSIFWTCVLLALSLGVSGCIVGAIMSGPQTYDIKAQYLGLQGKRVAVLVAADEYILFTQPKAEELISSAIATELAGNVIDVRVANPAQVLEFMRSNPYWTTMPYSELITMLEVDRLMVVDLSDYRLNEPGNQHIWRGNISANVLVIEGDSPDPDQAAFEAQIISLFPDNRAVGLVNADRSTVELATLQLFAVQVGHLFYDHEVTK